MSTNMNIHAEYSLKLRKNNQICNYSIFSNISFYDLSLALQ